MIYDKMQMVEQASNSYKNSMTACEGDSKNQLTKSVVYKKAGTNYAVTLEKLSKREEAVVILTNLKNVFGKEVRVFNNLGIIQKRKGDKDEALLSY